MRRQALQPAIRSDAGGNHAQSTPVTRMCGARPPAPTFFTLGKAFTQLRRVTPWLQAMPYVPVRYTLKHQADAWQRFFRGEAGRPRFKRRGRDSVTIPQDVRIRGDRLYFSKLGWLRLRRRGGNPYPDAEPVQATLRRVNGKWIAVVCYAIAAVERPDDGTVTGVDMNVGQVAVSNGRHARILHAPDPRRLEAKIRRQQRRGSRRHKRHALEAKAAELFLFCRQPLTLTTPRYLPRALGGATSRVQHSSPTLRFSPFQQLHEADNGPVFMRMAAIVLP